MSPLPSAAAFLPGDVLGDVVERGAELRDHQIGALVSSATLPSWYCADQFQSGNAGVQLVGGLRVVAPRGVG